MTFSLEAYQAIMLAITIVGSIFGAGKAFFGRIETSLKDRDDGLKTELSKMGDQMSKESEAIRQLDREILRRICPVSMSPKKTLYARLLW